MQTVPADRFKEAFLDEVRKVKKFFYGTVIAQAQRIDVENDRVVFTFGPQHRPLKSQLEQTAAAARDHRRAAVGPQDVDRAPRKGRRRRPTGRRRYRRRHQAPPDEKKAALREQALADSGVQAMLDVFAAEIKDVEEM